MSLGEALGGAFQGLGRGLVQHGENLRQEAREKRDAERRQTERAENRQWSQQDRAEDRAYRTEERDQTRQWGLDDEKRGIDRQNTKIDRAASALTGSKADFIKGIMPYAEKVGAEIGVDPQIIVAQAALETGWGKSAPGNNLFGIKSHGKSGGNNLSTTEVIDGKTVRINDSFRAFDSVEDAVKGYGEFLKTNPRYREMLSAGSLEDQIDALGRSGYATDPKYASKIRSIIGQIGSTANATELARVAADPDISSDVRSAALAKVSGSGAKRDTAKGADGFLYYTDTKERVFPDAQKPPADEYERYVRDETAAGRTPLERLEYGQAKKGEGVSVTSPDGTVLRVGGQPQKLNEGESKTLVYATRAKGAIETLDKYDDALGSRWERLADMDPTGLARELQSDEFQMAKQAGDEFLQAILRKDTGAAITEQEQALYGKTYLPQPGDSAALLRQKKASRARAIVALESGMTPDMLRRLTEADKEVFYGSEGNDQIAASVPQASRTDTSTASANLDFSNMSLAEINSVDIDAVLSVEQLDALEARVKQLERGGR